MARRRLLSDEAWAQLRNPPTDEWSIVRHYTLSHEDLALVTRKRTDATRLGCAVLLCYLRYPGRVLEAGETPPERLWCMDQACERTEPNLVWVSGCGHSLGVPAPACG